jgi:hypothetical protein
MYLGSAKNLRIRNLLHFYCRLLTKKEAIPVTRCEKLTSFSWGNPSFIQCELNNNSN